MVGCDGTRRGGSEKVTNWPYRTQEGGAPHYDAKVPVRSGRRRRHNPIYIVGSCTLQKLGCQKKAMLFFFDTKLSVFIAGNLIDSN